MRGGSDRRLEERRQRRREGQTLAAGHPLLTGLVDRLRVVEAGSERNTPMLAADAWAVIDERGTLTVNPWRDATKEDWAWVFATAALHLAWEHHRSGGRQRERWQQACAMATTAFLADLKSFAPPEDRQWAAPGRAKRETDYFDWLTRQPTLPAGVAGLSIGGAAGGLVWHEAKLSAELPLGPTVKGPSRQAATRPVARPAPVALGFPRWGSPPHWPDLWQTGLDRALSAALAASSGRRDDGGHRPGQAMRPEHETAKRWLMTHYPLLSALLAGFAIEDDVERCQRLGISIGAVDARARVIYLNPAAGLDQEEAIFVLAHELLHVALDHIGRRGKRDPYLWNVACDYVINAWLVEMQVGRVPGVGVLLDPDLQGLSADTIYDRLAGDLRRARRLRTLRGAGTGDMLEPGEAQSGEVVGLDEFVRRALKTGLSQHRFQGRGFLPVGLVEELEALEHPAPAWDVQLARWFEANIPQVDRVRTWARLSRRTSSTPDIPRPRWIRPPGEGKTFAVLMDTSGSMDSRTLQMALGAIAAFAAERGVEQLRLVYADAQAYDEGWVPVRHLVERVQIKGRGGTVLQPSIEWLLQQPNLPADAPLLIVTDGWTDRLNVPRPHAFLVPAGTKLPFRPQGPVFELD